MSESIPDFVEAIRSRVEPIEDPFYGPQYRCSLTLKDGTVLPCAILQSRARLVALAKRRIEEEMSGRGLFAGPDPFREIVSTFVAGGNRVAAYDVRSASPSRYAVPSSLRDRIEGETTMGWTGWVFRMRDGRLFSYGSAFRMDFLDLPDGYDFADVAEVINHAFVDASGALRALEQGGFLPEDYERVSVLRERVSFVCAVDGV